MKLNFECNETNSTALTSITKYPKTVCQFFFIDKILVTLTRVINKN